MAGYEAGRAEACHRAQAQADDRDLGEVVDHPVPALVVGDVAPAVGLEGLDRAAAGAVDQPDDRRRSSLAICSAKTCLLPMAASMAPPRTVKSSPPTTTGRPSILPRPMTKLAGWNSLKRPSAS